MASHFLERRSRIDGFCGDKVVGTDGDEVVVEEYYEADKVPNALGVLISAAVTGSGKPEVKHTTRYRIEDYERVTGKTVR